VTLPDRPKDVLKWQAHLDPEWLQELGRIAMFAAWVEETLHEIYWRHAELTVETGRIITGDLRPNRLSADILKLMKLRPDEKARLADIKILISEYKNLAEQRNQCIHWIWSRVASGAAWTMPPIYKTKIEPTKYTLEKLRQLEDDLAWLRIRLSAHVDTKSLRDRRAALGELSDFCVPAPWLDERLQPM
jgi:hypothetical protein